MLLQILIFKSRRGQQCCCSCPRTASPGQTAQEPCTSCKSMHALGLACPAQGAMADGCFLCSCRIFRASIARRYRSGGGRKSGTNQRLSLALCTWAPWLHPTQRQQPQHPPSQHFALPVSVPPHQVLCAQVLPSSSNPAANRMGPLDAFGQSQSWEIPTKGT